MTAKEPKPEKKAKKSEVTKEVRASRGQKIDTMIKAGKGAQEIVDAFDGAVTLSSVYVRKSTLKKAGELK